MKKQILLLTILVFLASILCAQNRIPKNSKNYLKNNVSQKHQVYEAYKADRLLDVRNIVHERYKLVDLEKIKNSFWVEDSTDYYSWDSGLNGWVVSGKVVYSYDANGNNLGYIYYDWDSELNGLIEDWRDECSYDANGNISEYFCSEWDPELNEWDVFWKEVYSYDTNGNHLELIFYAWDKTLNDWVADGKYTYSYDANGNATEQVWYTWDTELNDWAAAGEKTLYSYDVNGNMIEQAYYDWDSGLSDWVASTKGVSSYDNNGNMIEEIWSEWDFGLSVWDDYYKGVYNYDTAGNETLHINYQWDSDLNNWVKDEKYTHFYDINENETEMIKYNWDSGLSVWVEDDKEAHYWSLFDVIDESNNPPEINDSIEDQVVRENELYNFTISDTAFVDPDGDELTYSATLTDGSNLSTWLTFNATTRTFSGTPADMDLKSIRVTAEDQEGLNVYDDFILVVEGYDEVTEEEVAIDTTSSEDVATVTVPEQLFIDMGLGDDIEYTASLADGSSLPSYIAFDPSTLTFTITLDGKTSYKEVLAELDILVTGVDSDGYTATIGFIIEGTFLSDNINILVNLKVYPNPVKDKLIVEVPGNFNQKTIEIYSVLGQKLVDYKMLSEIIEIDFSSFKTSIYIINIVNDKESKALRIIKQ